MAVRRKASIKSRRQDKIRHLHNLKIKQELKKTIKKFQALISAKKIEEAKSFIKEVFSRLDKAAKKGIIHKGTATRKKSRFSRRLLKTA